MSRKEIWLVEEEEKEALSPLTWRYDFWDGKFKD